MARARSDVVTYGWLASVHVAIVAVFTMATLGFAAGFWFSLDRESSRLSTSDGAGDCSVERSRPDCMTTVPGVVVDAVDHRTGVLHYIEIDPSQAADTTSYFGYPGLVVFEPTHEANLESGAAVTVVLFRDEIFEVVMVDGRHFRSGRASDFGLLPVLFFMTAGFAALGVAGLVYLVARRRAALADLRLGRGNEDVQPERLAAHLVLWLSVASAVGSVVMWATQQFDLVAARQLVPVAVGTTLVTAAVSAASRWRREVTVR